MSSCFKEVYDYEVVQKCSKCKMIGSKTNFRKNSRTIDGLHLQCKHCRKQYYDENPQKHKINELEDQYRKN